MKKIVSLLSILFILFVLVGCFGLSEDTKSITVTKAPESTYIQGFSGEVSFEFTIEEGSKSTLYKVTWVRGEVKATVGDSSTPYTAAQLKEAFDISISTIEFNTLGIHTIIIKAGSIAASFEYEVISSEEPTGSGTVSDPFIIHTADQFIDVVYKFKYDDTDFSRDWIYIKLAADLDFSSVQLPAPRTIMKVSIDGAKPLGGNYKITNLTSSLFTTGTRLTLKNIDFVDCYSMTAGIVAENISNFYFENVNLLGNSLAALAGYLLTASTTSDDGTYNNEFVNCTSYAEVQTFGGSGSSMGGFIRYSGAGLTTFTDCKSYGKMVALGKKTLVGAFVGYMPKGNWKYKFIRCENKGDITVYARSSVIENYLNPASNDYAEGAITLVGTDINNDNDWTKNFNVEIIDCNLDTSKITVNDNFGELKFGELVNITGVVSYRVQMINNNSSGKVLDSNGTLIDATPKDSGGGLVYDQVFYGSFTLPTESVIRALKPYVNGAAEGQKWKNIDVINSIADSDLTNGVDYYDATYAPINGFRLADPKASITINIIGYDAQGVAVYFSSYTQPAEN